VSEAKYPSFQPHFTPTNLRSVADPMQARRECAIYSKHRRGNQIICSRDPNVISQILQDGLQAFD